MNADIIVELLWRYSESSSQNINYGKSSIMFNPSTLPCQKNKIADKLSISLVNIYDKFLGLPITILDPSNKPLILSKNRIALKCAGGRSSSCLREVRKSSLKLLLRQYLFMPCLILDYQCRYVRRSMGLFLNSGGAKNRMRKNSIWFYSLKCVTGRARD